MAANLDRLERTLLELGTEIFRVKHRMEHLEKENNHLQEIIVSLRSLLDDKGLVSTEDFDEAVALDKIMARQASAGHDAFASPSDSELKKAIN